MTDTSTVIVIGGEPAALSCAARLLHEGATVVQVFPEPWGLLGASRDIGVAYPEVGEPIERLEYSLGTELAAEYHAWAKNGIDLLAEHGRECPGLRRGSRLSLQRNEQEAGLAGADALERQRLGDEVRLMSGGAASNYAPLSTMVHQASFETHAMAFAPAVLCQHLSTRLAGHQAYQPRSLHAQAWESCRIEGDGGGVRVRWQDGEIFGDVAVVAAGLDTGRLLGKFDRVLAPLLGQAFRSEPLRESTRSSVVALTASWGNERFRFDEDRRLLGCGIDPGSGQRFGDAVVLEKTQDAFWKRSTSLFSDLARSGDDILRWGVLFTTTCDGLPLLGPLPGEPRIHLVEGFSISAWSRGYEAGDRIARCLATGCAPAGLVNRCTPRRLL